VIRRDAPYHVFAGEETASVAFAAMLRSLPKTAEVHGVVEAADQVDQLELARPLDRVQRGDASAEDSAAPTRCAHSSCPTAPGSLTSPAKRALSRPCAKSSSPNAAGIGATFAPNPSGRRAARAWSSRRARLDYGRPFAGFRGVASPA
jgi:Siderophore-interacting protein